jgi:mannose-6-phosphate isomerase-like protein (cupin superfamily)
MPRSGDHYVMPDGLGEYLLVRLHEETEGEYVEMEWSLPASAFAPPPDRHPTQVESYEVLEGSFDVMIDGAWRPLATGDSATVPVNAGHTFRLVGEPMRVRNVHRLEAGSTNSSSVSTGSSPPRAFADSGTHRLQSPSLCSPRSGGCGRTAHPGEGESASRPKRNTPAGFVVSKAEYRLRYWAYVAAPLRFVPLAQRDQTEGMDCGCRRYGRAPGLGALARLRHALFVRSAWRGAARATSG